MQKQQAQGRVFVSAEAKAEALLLAAQASYGAWHLLCSGAKGWGLP